MVPAGNLARSVAADVDVHVDVLVDGDRAEHDGDDLEWEEGQGPALSVYETEGSSADALNAHYRKVLPDLGWLLLTPEVDGEKPTRGLMVMRDGQTTIVASTTTDKGRALVSMLPMDSHGAVSMDAAASQP